MSGNSEMVKAKLAFRDVATQTPPPEAMGLLAKGLEALCAGIEQEFDALSERLDYFTAQAG